MEKFDHLKFLQNMRPKSELGRIRQALMIWAAYEHDNIGVDYSINAIQDRINEIRDPVERQKFQEEYDAAVLRAIKRKILG